MKKIYLNILTAVILMFSSYSCSAGWLDLEPSDEASAGEAIKNKADAKVAMNGVYAIIKGYKDPGVNAYREYYMADMVYYGDIRADDVQSYSNSSGRGKWAYEMTFTGSSGASNMWYIPYKVIYSANRLKKYIDEGAITDATQAELDNLMGQILMARALAHFDLLRIYSPFFDLAKNGEKYGVPIVLDTHGFEFSPGRDSINKVYARVLQDLGDAEKLMSGNNGNGAFNKWTAKALLARVHQYMENDTEALKVAKDVIENGPYNLWSNKDYAKAWAIDPTSQEASEILFQIVITSKEDWTDREGVAYLYGEAGYGDFHITQSFYDMINKDYKNDVRLELLVPSTDAAIQADLKGKHIFINKYAAKGGSDDMRLSNIPLLRLSETYLIAAESAARLGNSADASKYLNAIVLRGNPNAIPVSDSEATVDRVLTEKRIELVGEGQRYFDLIRNNKDIVRHENKDGAEGWHLPLKTEALKYNRDYFRAILPIPKRELDANKGIAGQQNPGY